MASSYSSQNRASLFKILSSALGNKRAALELTDVINAMQDDIAALTAKLDADLGVADTDYAAEISADNNKISQE